MNKNEILREAELLLSTEGNVLFESKPSPRSLNAGA